MAESFITLPDGTKLRVELFVVAGNTVASETQMIYSPFTGNAITIATTGGDVGDERLGVDSILRAGSKGATLAAVVTSTSIDANHQALDVTGTVTVSGTTTVTGAVTANIGTTGGLALDATIAARLGVLGQAAMAASAPVVIASDQSAIPVSGTVTANVGTTGGLALDATITARLNTLGQKTMAASAPVVIASDQSPVPVSGTVAVGGTVTANIGTTGGLALDATIIARLGVLGQAAMAASAPVVIASDQSPIPITGSITATNPSVGLNNAAIPTSSTQIGGSDGTNLQASHVFDLDTGAGTEYSLGVGLRISGAGGSIEAKGQKVMASSIPVVIASDQSAIPVSGTVTATGPLTDTQLRATPVPVSGTVTATGPLTDAQLRAAPVPVSGTISTGGLTDAELRATPVPVSGTVSTGGLTDAELRATPVPVSGTVSTGGLTDAELRATPVPVSGTVSTGGLTDAELRATPVPVSGTVSTGGLTDAELRATPVPVSGPLTDAQLRATPVPISGTVSTGGLTDTQLRATPVPVSGTVTATGPLTDTQLRATPVPVSGTVSTGGLTDAELRATPVPVSGPLTDTQLRAAPVPVSGTVSTNGLTDAQLRATAVPVSSTQLPAALVGGRLDENIGAWLGSTAPTVGQKVMASSIPVVISSDQSSIAVTATGTVTANIGTTGGLALDATITARLNTLGQKTMANSAPVVIASDQSAIPITGTVTALNASVGLNNAAIPTSSTQIGGSDGTNLQAGHVFDLDTGAGTEYSLGVGLRISGAGGSIEAKGQKVMASSIPVVIASDQSAIPVSGPLTDAQLRATPVPVSGTVSTGGLTDAQLRATAVPVSGTVTANQGTGAAAAAPWSVELSDGAAFYTGTKTGQLPAALVGGRLDENIGAWLGSTAPTVGQKTMANSLPVVIASDQSAIPVSGTVTALNASVGLNNAAIPTSSTQIGGTDGTNLQAAHVFDLDTGAGTEYDIGVGLRISGAGGSIEAKGQKVMASSIPVVIASDQSAVPISGTVTANQGTAATAAAPWSVELSDGAAFYTGTKTGQLPAALVGARLDTNIGAWLGSTAPTVGQKTMANSVPVVISSDQSAIPVSGTITANIGTTNGLALDATITARLNTLGQKTMANSAPVVIASDQSAIPVTSTQLPAALVGARLDTNIGAWLGSTAPTVGSKTSANSIPVVIASDQGAIAITPPTLTKSTQGATGFSVQELKDAGRVSKVFQQVAITGIVAETLLTLVMLSDLVAAAGATSYTVTAGKRLRLIGVFVTWRNNTAAAGGVTVRVRAIATAPAVLGSACIATANATTSLATIGSGASAFALFTEGFELPAGAGVGVTQQAVGAVVGFDVQLVGYEY